MAPASTRTRQPSVSLCTVTRNRSLLLPLLEQCVLAQTYPRELLEWVILDDSDHGIAPFTPLEGTGLVVRYERLPQPIPLESKRNLAHRRCSGEVIVQLDDDDVYPATRVEHAVERLLASDRLVAGCTTLPILFVPELELWWAGPYPADQVPAGTLAFRREALGQKHRGDPAGAGGEVSFLGSLRTPVEALDPMLTILSLGHPGSTVIQRDRLLSEGKIPLRHLGGREKVRLPKGQIEAYLLACQGIDPAIFHPPAPPPRIAVITPYHREDLAILERCHRSVRAQTVACTHFLVSDGPGRSEIDTWPCRHIVLGTGHNDNGNTPRAIGGLCAMNEGFDAIAYLDADNWFRPEHLESVITCQQNSGAEVVFSGREIVFPDGRILQEEDAEDQSRQHVDTSCMVLFRPAFKALALWAEMPPQYAPYCDRVGFQHLRQHFRCAWTKRRTTFFETWYWLHFTSAGELPPANVKYLPRRSWKEWEEANERFRQQSHTPLTIQVTLRGQASLILCSILGPPRSGSTVLQRELCRHGGFFGIPENGFLFWYRQLFGADGRVRHRGQELIDRFRAICGENPQDQWWREHVVELDRVLARQQPYTALQAYEEVVKAAMPLRARRYMDSMGTATIFDKTLLTSLAADLLFTLLPAHRAVLCLRDPIDQICAMRQIASEQPGTWKEPHRPIEELCLRYIEFLRLPLLAAPAGQVLLLAHEAFLPNAREALRRIGSFMGVSVNEGPEAVQRIEASNFAVNPIYQQQLEAIEADLEAELTNAPTPWKQRSLREPLSPTPHHYEALCHLSEQELAFALAVFRPFYDHPGWIYAESPHGRSRGQMPPPAEMNRPAGALIQKRDGLMDLLGSRLQEEVKHVVAVPAQGRP